MAKKNPSTLQTASVLAFERKLDPSDALFFSGNWQFREGLQWAPVPVREKSVRGTISNRLKAKEQDPARLDAAIENPNLQTVDVAALPADADTLKATFTVRVLGGVGVPSACNDQAYQSKLMAVVQEYVAQHGFAELARRYAHNLANGRFLWRNRIGAESVETHIARLVDGSEHTVWKFDSLSIPLRQFSVDLSDLDALSKLIEQGLSGAAHVLLKISAYARMGAGQEVFPSQELVLDKGDKSKTLYVVGGTAGIHSQKIGNALRTIDTWYPGAEELGPIAAEPYGSVTTQGKAYRQPREKTDFYSLLDNWVLRDQIPDIGQQHFVMSILVRGGVFGDAG